MYYTLSQVCHGPHPNLLISKSYKATYLTHILCFPQMRPEAASEKVKVESEKSEYLELRIPEEWVVPLKAIGFDTIDKLKEVEKPGKLANDLNGYKKKKNRFTWVESGSRRGLDQGLDRFP